MSKKSSWNKTKFPNEEFKSKNNSWKNSNKKSDKKNKNYGTNIINNRQSL